MRRRLPQVTVTTSLALALAGGLAVPAASAVTPRPKPVTPASAAVVAAATPAPGGAHAGSGLASDLGRSGLTSAAVTSAATIPSGIRGVDVSGHQGSVDWKAAWANGARFAIVKATESTGFRNSSFAQQYNGSAAVGMIRGAYHFANPINSDGKTQADFFLANGGAWTADGKTLPPALDIEYDPYVSRDHTNTCYGLTDAQMVRWVRDFTVEIKKKTGRDALIYTTTDWWRTCTGNSAAFSANPLWLARYSATAGTMPASWKAQTIWQYNWYGAMPGDQNVFHGSAADLRAFARGSVAPTGSTPARLSLTVPSRVSVGSAATRITWSARDTQPTRSVTTTLALRGRTLATATGTTRSAQATQSSAVVLPASRITGWGVHTLTARSADTATTATARTDVRARTITASALTRSGSTVRLVGAVKQYDPRANRYAPSAARPMTVQKLTANGWRNLRTVPTDRLGHIAVAVPSSTAIRLRVVTTATAGSWNAAGISGRI